MLPEVLLPVCYDIVQLGHLAIPVKPRPAARVPGWCRVPCALLCLCLSHEGGMRDPWYVCVRCIRTPSSHQVVLLTLSDVLLAIRRLPVQGVDWTQVQGLIDCSAELKELVAPGGEEDLFHASSGDNFDIIAEEDLLEDLQMAPELNIGSSAPSPTAYAPSLSSCCLVLKGTLVGGSSFHHELLYYLHLSKSLHAVFRDAVLTVCTSVLPHR